MDDVKEFLLWCRAEGIQQVTLTPDGGVTAVFSNLAMVPVSERDEAQGSARSQALSELTAEIEKQARLKKAAEEFDDPDSPLDEDPDLYYSAG